MSNYEESAKAIESDYRYAPVGMAVGSFWGGSLVAGLTAFVMSTGVAKGFLPTVISGDQRVVFVNDYVGLYDGLFIAAVLLVMSILIGLAGRGALAKKGALGGLWKGMIAIPILTLFVTVITIVVKH